MARWAGEGKDWIQLMTQTQPRKEDVVRTLLESMKQPVDKKKESKGSVPTMKPRDPPWNTGTWRETDTGDQKEQLNDCGLDERPRQDENEDWHREKAQKLLRERTTDWVTHTFREHNKEADLWASKGAKWRAEEWVDTTRITWKEVTGVCGFWDGSFDNGRCGRRIVLMVLGTTRWFPFDKSVALHQGIAPWMLKWVDADTY